MKVQALCSINSGQYNRGNVIDLPDNEAGVLITYGAAKALPIDDGATETKSDGSAGAVSDGSAGAVPAASLPLKRRRRRRKKEVSDGN